MEILKGFIDLAIISINGIIQLIKEPFILLIVVIIPLAESIINKKRRY